MAATTIQDAANARPNTIIPLSMGTCGLSLAGPPANKLRDAERDQQHGPEPKPKDVPCLDDAKIVQEKDHADTLSTAVSQLGGHPARPKASYDFPHVRNQRDVLLLVNMIENTAIAAYLDALPKLSSPDLRATAASIVTTESEHASVLLGALGRPQVPSAFVVGRR